MIKEFLFDKGIQGMLGVAFLLALTLAGWSTFKTYADDMAMFLKISMQTQDPGTAVLYYDAGKGLNEESKSSPFVSGDGLFHELSFRIPFLTTISGLRFDPPSLKTGQGIITRVELVDHDNRVLHRFSLDRLKAIHQIKDFVQEKGEVRFSIEAGANDPQINIRVEEPLRLDRWRIAWVMLGRTLLKGMVVFLCCIVLIFIWSRWHNKTIATLVTLAAGWVLYKVIAIVDADMVKVPQMVLLVVVLIPLCSFAPGYALVRRLQRFDPIEKLVASVGFSLILLYLFGQAIFVSGVSWHWAWAGTALSAAVFAFYFKEIRRLFAVPSVKLASLCFGGLFLWNLLMLGIIRNSTGGGWGGDWYEHFDRAVWFIDHGPLNHLFTGIYLLPARPPLMNMIASFFLAQVGKEYASFQVLFSFMNLLPFLACALLARLFVRQATKWIVLVALVFAFNPLFLQNAQYTWTKGATSFYVLAALWFYIQSWRRQDVVRMGVAFFSLSAGLLIHYSAGPYILVFVGHYLCYVFWTRHSKVKELLVSAVPSAALLATWFAYSLHAYGVYKTVATNSAVTDSLKMNLAQNLEKMALNIADTLKPYVFYQDRWFNRTDSNLLQFIDNSFLLYQSNLMFAMGVSGV
ncbi:MAG: hypothetical protein C0390_12545, partial [Syntrophus sp. (in: bacteria)]|nr:hypothetical protein [Syntrophus sp. (in: bacteria)]